ncbi:prenyltransferase/squalene oxidase repeat-containing protein [Aeromicrobium wangtongii]|uniref:prenyltransferase/squalene oxidase repeat-containing protein n=1 Tax=Aeromicrobium wangtongii TaxID=2969247 RepID=UPI002016FA36|nr:prenyltransferase/squalene oxidase repeat-containing protein [Aeromicrobium wangtongii]MCL3820329.1 hypothetical protein [Aeromicrobium wangtongii]
MNRTLLRRLAIIAIAPALVACSSDNSPTADDAGPAGPQRAAVSWLADQPAADGLFTSHYADVETGKTVAFVDHGLNLDLYAALTELGDDKTAETVYRATIEKADEYTDPPGGTRYAGAVGKLASMVQAHGDDANALGSRHLIDELEALLVKKGEEAGRAKDSPDSEFQSTNIVNQAWVVRALATAGSDDADAAIDFLLKQQCDDGSFREEMTAAPCADGRGSVDGTAFAIQSLQVAADEGSDEVEDDIAEAVDWLIGAQAEDGSFGGADGANVNSTGLGAVALALTGHDQPAAQAAAWVASLQVADGPEKGAIALNEADRSAAGSKAIADVDRDRYVRASVQAVRALTALPAENASGSR